MKDKNTYQGSWTGLNYDCPECLNHVIINTDFMFARIPEILDFDKSYIENKQYNGFCPICGDIFNIANNSIPDDVKEFLCYQKAHIYNYACKIRDVPNRIGIEYRQKKRQIIEFSSLPVKDQTTLIYTSSDDSPIFEDLKLTELEKLGIYLRKVSHYMDVISEARRINNKINDIVWAFYEEDYSYKDAIRSDDMYALAAACYHSEKDFGDETQYSKKHNDKYNHVIKPLIRKMRRR